MPTIYDFKVTTRDGKEFSLSDLKGKVLLIVNTATGCGFTPQYEGIENLYKKYHDQGLEVLDFPCDQFGHQAPGSNDEIHEFCTLKYNTTFDQFAKCDVIGDNAIPLYKFLAETTKSKVRWNFNKYLVSRDGEVIKHYGSMTKPEKIEKDIVERLSENE